MPLSHSLHTGHKPALLTPTFSGRGHLGQKTDWQIFVYTPPLSTEVSIKGKGVKFGSHFEPLGSNERGDDHNMHSIENSQQRAISGVGLRGVFLAHNSGGIYDIVLVVKTWSYNACSWS